MHCKAYLKLGMEMKKRQLPNPELPTPKSKNDKRPKNIPSLIDDCSLQRLPQK
jgi:hypothetical protein